MVNYLIDYFFDSVTFAFNIKILMIIILEYNYYLVNFYSLLLDEFLLIRNYLVFPNCVIKLHLDLYFEYSLIFSVDFTHPIYFLSH